MLYRDGNSKSVKFLSNISSSYILFAKLLCLMVVWSLILSFRYRCPICLKTIADMSQTWALLDWEVWNFLYIFLDGILISQYSIHGHAYIHAFPVIFDEMRTRKVCAVKTRRQRDLESFSYLIFAMVVLFPCIEPCYINALACRFSSSFEIKLKISSYTGILEGTVFLRDAIYKFLKSSLF